jgi:2-amino-4-hydroxy-6-hydroxymethyldihydropteridine diphosphokinase
LTHSYVIALGSNMRKTGLGPPRAVVGFAVKALAAKGLKLLDVSPILDSAPIGPSLRRYANAAVLLEADLQPEAMLGLLQAVEGEFGRKRRGQSWRARVLDLDIVMWSGGAYQSQHLTIPHAHFRERDFVLLPTSAIAGEWRDPISGLSVRHLAARLAKITG